MLTLNTASESVTTLAKASPRITRPASWLRKAADQGNAGSQFILGAMYFRSRGVPQDYVSAHMWMNLSAAAGEKDAEKLRDTIATLMTRSQIAEAQKLAREWKPKWRSGLTAHCGFKSPSPLAEEAIYGSEVMYPLCDHRNHSWYAAERGIKERLKDSSAFIFQIIVEAIFHRRLLCRNRQDDWFGSCFRTVPNAAVLSMQIGGSTSGGPGAVLGQVCRSWRVA
jgi:hypothetical protein